MGRNKYDPIFKINMVPTVMLYICHDAHSFMTPGLTELLSLSLSLSPHMQHPTIKCLISVQWQKNAIYFPGYIFF